MLHAVAPAYVNSMQQPQAQVHAVTSAQYVPPPVPSAQYMAPAYYAADGVQATPGARGQVERGQVVQVGQLMSSFPAPASTGGATGVPTATVSQYPQAQAHVPVAQHVPETQGISRNDARVSCTRV